MLRGQFVELARRSVLGLFAGQRRPKSLLTGGFERAVGLGLGVFGLMAIFNPVAFDWRDRGAIAGNAALLRGAMLWAASIVHNRSHSWRSTPFHRGWYGRRCVRAGSKRAAPLTGCSGSWAASPFRSYLLGGLSSKPVCESCNDLHLARLRHPPRIFIAVLRSLTHTREKPFAVLSWLCCIRSARFFDLH
jgi:hypothetical protein